MFSPERFKRAADYLAQGKGEIRIFLSEPRPKEKLFLRYLTKTREMNIVWEDGVKLSPKLQTKIMPMALAILTQIYWSEKKKQYVKKETN